MTFNRSEYIAFKSGRGLSEYLNQIKSRFPNYSLNVAVHSQGGIVLMEALREQLFGGFHAVDNCVLMEAAVPAHCFDPRDNLNHQPFLNNEAGDPTPDVYRGYPGAIRNSINGLMANFFNAVDYALVTGPTWEWNQVLFKPDTGFGYHATANSALLDTPAGVTIVLEDPREAMAFCARPRSKALGAVPGVGFEIQGGEVDLGPGTVHGFSASSSDHSAAWRRTVQQTRLCYDALLEAFNF